MIIIIALLFLPVLYLVGAVIFGAITGVRASAELLKPKDERFQGDFWKSGRD